MPVVDASQSRYSAVAIVLHWAIAILIVMNLLVGMRLEDLKGMTKFFVLQWHKSYGITVLVLTLARLGWRVFHRPPPFPEHMSAWEKAAARAAHWGFYVLMVALPVTGWMMVSASPTNIPTLLYTTIPWPHIDAIHSLQMTTRKVLEGNLHEVHEYLAWGMTGLLALHVAAALKHQFWNRDTVLWGMVPVGVLKPKPAKET